MTHHLAEFNFGTLRYPWGDPRIVGFEDAVDQVNAIGARSPGFVWRMPDDEMEFAQEDPAGSLYDRPNTASTLSVWEDAGALYRFVTKTLHARIMKGAPDWFVPGDSGHLVCWRVPQGHRPDVAEGLARWHVLQRQGESENIFGANMLRRLATQNAA
ncbi:uncharacterized protein DUF3291 [Yoonia maricola]|uniref:Uncharacterized protein DUF3291 n=1 Tax=Yoonia maricola TaxID=420999 RepID=A0A2M8WN29_9RHOB|nr:DUF3291 domain-containing protein [Yoonia maricola]PJI92266.1 uncharacterized protein DUF3291 [Yoonia maricola]